MGFVSGHTVTNVFYGLSWLCSLISPHPLPRSVMKLVRFRNPCMLPRLRTSAQRARTGCPLTGETGCAHFYDYLSCLSEGLLSPPEPSSSMKAGAPYPLSLQNSPFSFLSKFPPCSGTLRKTMIWEIQILGEWLILANRFIYFPRGIFFFNEYTLEPETPRTEFSASPHVPDACTDVKSLEAV